MPCPEIDEERRIWPNDDLKTQPEVIKGFVFSAFILRSSKIGMTGGKSLVALMDIIDFDLA